MNTVQGTSSEIAAAPGNNPGNMRALLRYFLYLGTLGFGGPIALAGYTQRDLVERRRWIRLDPTGLTCRRSSTRKSRG